MNHWIVFFYGLILLILGVYGYARAHSIPSLVMGSIFGLIMIICGMLMSKWPKASELTALICSAFLTLFFSYRFYSSQMIFPAGVMALLSLIVTGFLFSSRRW